MLHHQLNSFPHPVCPGQDFCVLCSFFRTAQIFGELVLLGMQVVAFRRIAATAQPIATVSARVSRVYSSSVFCVMNCPTSSRVCSSRYNWASICSHWRRSSHMAGWGERWLEIFSGSLPGLLLRAESSGRHGMRQCLLCRQTVVWSAPSAGRRSRTGCVLRLQSAGDPVLFWNG